MLLQSSSVTQTSLDKGARRKQVFIIIITIITLLFLAIWMECVGLAKKSPLQMVLLDSEHTEGHKEIRQTSLERGDTKRGREDFETTDMNFKFPVDHTTGIRTWLCNREGRVLPAPWHCNKCLNKST